MVHLELFKTKEKPNSAKDNDWEWNIDSMSINIYNGKYINVWTFIN